MAVMAYISLENENKSEKLNDRIIDLKLLAFLRYLRLIAILLIQSHPHIPAESVTREMRQFSSYLLFVKHHTLPHLEILSGISSLFCVQSV